jgi:beta-lactamase regulating signal transducer with metallopeptidase domain
MWLIGCLVVLARCLAGHLLVRRLVARSEAPARRHAAALHATLDELGIDRDVRLLVSPDVAAPITCGALTPVILVPRDVNEWSDERRRVVLIHELAHVSRFDYLAQLLGTIACGLFWFHPGVWLAASRLRSESELAADDRVLAAGTSGVSYATHLLEVARAEREMSLAVAVAVGMARSTRLEGRFRAMLDSTRSRANVSLRAQVVAGGLAFLALVPLAGLRTELAAAPSRARQAASASVAGQASAMAAASRAAASVSMVPAVIAQAVVPVADSTFEQTISAAPGERLVLELSTGGEIVVQGWDEPRVRLRAALSGRNWRETRVTLDRLGGSVRLRSRFERDLAETSTSHRFELWVPRRFDIQLSSSGGGVSIRDVSGDFRGHTGGGVIEIEGASGRAALSTGGGNIVVEGSNLAGWVSSGSGPTWSNTGGMPTFNGVVTGMPGGFAGTISPGSGVNIGVSARGIATTTVSGTGYATSISNQTGITTVGVPQGGVTGVVPGSVGVAGGTIVGMPGSTMVGVQGGTGMGVPGGVTVSGGQSGQSIGIGRSTSSNNTTTITTDRAGDLSAVTVAQGYGSNGVRISKAGGGIDIESAPDGGSLFTGGGEIYVGSSGGFLSATTGGGDIEMPHVTGNVNVSTGAGTVMMRVVNVDGRAHTVTIRSGKGRVEIELPADLDARVDIETAYTENFERATRIDSDFALEHSETTTWDNSMGTPRRYVRALGVVGSGRGLIHIRTVNGDVRVTRR